MLRNKILPCYKTKIFDLSSLQNFSHILLKAKLLVAGVYKYVVF